MVGIRARARGIGAGGVVPMLAGMLQPIGTRRNQVGRVRLCSVDVGRGGPSEGKKRLSFQIQHELISDAKFSSKPI